MAHGACLRCFDLLFELCQTLCTAQCFAAVIHLEPERRVAAGVTVLADGQVAETEEAGFTADLVDCVLLYDLMFANAVSAAHAAL